MYVIGTDSPAQSQFNGYVNAHAEELRSLFVEHEGKKELCVATEGSRYTVDFAWMSRAMANLIAKNVIDPDLRDWIVPAFSTTTLNDKSVSCIIMMATLKAYFSYGFSCLSCGLPQVTLEGTKEDWEKLRERIEKLKTYGVECVAWYHLLAPVLDRFVLAFDNPTGAENIAFWQKVAHKHNGSGTSYLSGWITAFCVFDQQGKWLGHSLENVQQVSTREPPTNGRILNHLPI